MMSGLGHSGKAGAETQAPVCRIICLKKHFSAPGGALEVLKGIDLDVAAGEMVSVIGPSGVGKSTLLHIVGALDPPSEGKVLIAERDPYALGENERARLRNHEVGFVFQFHHLLSEFSALENVAMPLLVAEAEPERAFMLARKMLENVGLADRADHRPGKLSGGEQQRVAVARALVASPSLVLADEPSGNLDEGTALHLHELLSELKEKVGRTFLIATHNPDLARRSDRVFRIVEGRLKPELEGPMAPQK
jgi:lipoprotein-releasing system ATP-binding protein